MLERLHLARLPWPRPDPRGDEQLEQDLADEFEFHIQQRRRDYEGQGLDRAAARDAAEARFGDVQRIKAQCRRIAREERIMLQKINLVLMIVVLLAVIGVSVQMYVTQRYNTLALNALSVQLAEKVAHQKAAERARGVVYVYGDIVRPGVYQVPPGGFAIRRLLVTAGMKNMHASVSVRRDVDNATEHEYTLEVFPDGTFNGDDMTLQAGDIVVTNAIDDSLVDAATEKARADALQEFVLQLLSNQDPELARDLAVKDVLDDAAGKLDEQIVNDPEIEAKIREAIEAAKRQMDDPKPGG